MDLNLFYLQATLVRKEFAAQCIQKIWERYLNVRVFSLVKRCLATIEQSKTAQMKLIKLVCPGEISLIKDFSCWSLVLKLDGCEFPPNIVFKIATFKKSKYMKSSEVIPPGSAADYQSLKNMGRRCYLRNLVWERFFEALSSEKYLPVKFGGKNDVWRPLGDSWLKKSTRKDQKPRNHLK